MWDPEESAEPQLHIYLFTNLIVFTISFLSCCQARCNFIVYYLFKIIRMFYAFVNLFVFCFCFILQVVVIIIIMKCFS